MMGFNPLIGWTQAELETELEALQTALVAGGTVTSAGTGSVNWSMERETGLRERIEMVLRALNALDPTTYPIESCLRITATTFSQPQ